MRVETLDQFPRAQPDVLTKTPEQQRRHLTTAIRDELIPPMAWLVDYPEIQENVFYGYRGAVNRQVNASWLEDIGQVVDHLSGHEDLALLELEELHNRLDEWIAGQQHPEWLAIRICHQPERAPALLDLYARKRLTDRQQQARFLEFILGNDNRDNASFPPFDRWEIQMFLATLENQAPGSVSVRQLLGGDRGLQDKLADVCGNGLKAGYSSWLQSQVAARLEDWGISWLLPSPCRRPNVLLGAEPDEEEPEIGLMPEPVQQLARFFDIRLCPSGLKQPPGLKFADSWQQGERFSLANLPEWIETSIGSNQVSAADLLHKLGWVAENLELASKPASVNQLFGTLKQRNRHPFTNGRWHQSLCGESQSLQVIKVSQGDFRIFLFINFSVNGNSRSPAVLWLIHRSWYRDCGLAGGSEHIRGVARNGARPRIQRYTSR